MQETLRVFMSIDKATERQATKLFYLIINSFSIRSSGLLKVQPALSNPWHPVKSVTCWVLQKRNGFINAMPKKVSAIQTWDKANKPGMVCQRLKTDSSFLFIINQNCSFGWLCSYLPSLQSSHPSCKKMDFPVFPIQENSMIKGPQEGKVNLSTLSLSAFAVTANVSQIIWY